MFLLSYFFQNSIHVGCYLANDEEFDCLPIIRALWQAGKQCYVPIITAGNRLAFSALDASTGLTRNRYHILEPATFENFPAIKLDLVIMPLVAFDAQGNRVGMGGGYYDRTFAFLKAGNKTPKLMGLAYKFQEVSELISDPWDVKLDAVLTENKLLVIK